VFVPSNIQDAMRMRHIILLTVECPTLQYFPTLFHKRHDFRKKVVTEHKCVF
jgi:hypothetical protein